ncbi:MAG: pilus assembly protein PilZ [Methylophaga sp.]|nr:MAG: pilus assembly protein PilZ [Methylophaga sp.]
MNTINDRRHARIKHTASIKVLTHPEKSYVLEMRDFSDSGLYLQAPENLVKVGDTVEVQTLEMDDAPVLVAKVIRIIKGKGFAVEFDDF